MRKLTLLRWFSVPVPLLVSGWFAAAPVTPEWVRFPLIITGFVLTAFAVLAFMCD